MVNMTEETVWSGLGTNVLGANKIEELSQLVRNIQVELMGSVESLGRRVSDLEVKINLLLKAVDRLETLPQGNQPPVSPMGMGMADNVFMFMSEKELGIERTAEEKELVDVDEVEVRSVKGFTAPPPEKEVPEDEEVMAERGNLDTWLSAISEHIAKEGGVMNNHLKRLNLIPSDISSEEREELIEKLHSNGVREHKVSRASRFYFVGEGESLVRYEEYVNR